MRLLRAIGADLARYRDLGGGHRRLGFWVGAAYRVGAALHATPSWALGVPLLAGYKALVLPIQLFRKVEIPARTPIGEGLCLPNPYGIVMPPTVEIGPGCTIHGSVTLGLGPVPGVPRLGRDVTLMPGAKVLGGVRVGDGVIVGANAVVTKDVPPGIVIQSPMPRVSRHGDPGERAESA